MKKRVIFLFALLVIVISAYCQTDSVIFNSENWQLINGEFTDYQGKHCLKGTASLIDTDFSNGIIEFDLIVDGRRSYPGIYFRVESPGNYEHFYIRPHRIWYDDALQYAPAFNGASCWQLYHGDGINAAFDIPKDEWIHFRIEVLNDQARVFINNEIQPAIFITDLKHGNSSGGITLNAQANGSAYFSNFRIAETDNLDFPMKKKTAEPYGMIRDWEVTDVLNFQSIQSEKIPDESVLSGFNWHQVSADQSGLINLSKLYPRTHRTGDAVYARTIINSPKDEVRQYYFGYSDMISIFINSRIMFTGMSPYQYRDNSFLGILGLFDVIYLPLKEGKNELLLISGEGFGGWGFIFQDADTAYVAEGIEKAWETNADFIVPESVVYDPKRDALYVTNFDQFSSNTTGRVQYISKVSTEGEIIDLHFIDSLDNPLGMQLYKDKLYVAEKGGYAVVDLKKKTVIDHVQIPGAIFPNDLEIDSKGRIYISDSRKDAIWKCEKGDYQVWLEGEDILDPNTLRVIDNRLLVGNSGDQLIKAFNLDTREMEIIADVGPGFIDGMRLMSNGDLLVSVWQGYLFRITPEGEVIKIMDLNNKGIYIADFEYIPETGMLYIPSFYVNKVIAYKIGE